MRLLSKSIFPLSAFLLLAGCGQSQTKSVLSPAEPAMEDPSEPADAQESPSNELEQDGAAPGDTPETESQPEDAPPPIQVWTAPEGEELVCDNTQVPFTFAPSDHTFSLNNAFWTMWFAKRSFTGHEQATEDEIRGLGFDNYRFIANDPAGLQVLIAANDESLVIAYQGSKQIIDWFANFYFLQREATLGVAGRVHQGFATVLDSEWTQIMETIQAFHRPTQSIWISGHSLGAALSTLTAARLTQAGYDIAPLYTHASPRVGDDAFARQFYERTQGKHFRFVHGLDIVPHLPPAGSAAHAAANFIPLGLTGFAEGFLSDLDFTHAGTLYRIETDGALTHFPGLQEQEDNDYWSNLGFTSLFDMIVSDAQEALHNENSYLCRLRDLWQDNHSYP